MDFLIVASMAEGLAFLTGINAYLPLLIVGLVGQFHLVPGFEINPEFASFVTHPATLIILALLTILDFVADKIPGASMIWNTIHTFLRPVAGALVAGAVGTEHQTLFAAITGAIMATLSHTAKMGVRTTASAATGGGATPVLSVVEDIGVVIGSILVFVAPWLVLAFLVVFLAIFLLYAPSFFGALRFQLRVVGAFLFGAERATWGPLDFLSQIPPDKRTQLMQALPNERVQAGAILIWHLRLNGRGPWGRRRIAIPTCFVVMQSALLLFPPSRPGLSLVVPFASVRRLDLRKGIMRATLRVEEHSGQLHQLSVLRTERTIMNEIVQMLYTQYHLASGGVLKSLAKLRPSWLGGP
jgi:uncharacterized membrane protein